MFSQIFAIFDDFSNNRRALGAIHLEKSSNMEKIWGKIKKFHYSVEL